MNKKIICLKYQRQCLNIVKLSKLNKNYFLTTFIILAPIENYNNCKILPKIDSCCFSIRNAVGTISKVILFVCTYIFKKCIWKSRILPHKITSKGTYRIHQSIPQINNDRCKYGKSLFLLWISIKMWFKYPCVGDGY